MVIMQQSRISGSHFKTFHWYGDVHVMYNIIAKGYRRI